MESAATTVSPTQTSSKSNILATGLAMFSMFFGAGNVVFPLALGQYAQDQTFFAILGLLITAVGVPFAGLMAMTLFDGDYKKFFGRIGKTPGFILAAIIMGLIGPLGAMPRCITLSYSTIKTYLPMISLPIFSIISCLIIFLFTFRKNRIIDVLGLVLTPILLLSLGVIIVKGFFISNETTVTDFSSMTSFIHGLNEGYQTMDLLGAFFFSGVVIVCLKQGVEFKEEESSYKKILSSTMKASCIGAFLLAIIYVGFSYVAAFNSHHLADLKQDELLAVLAMKILGPYAGIIACLAVALACLTTAIALSVVFAEFFSKEVCKDKVGYVPSLCITLVAAFFVSTLNFTGIVKFLAPILQVCYPALIVLSLLNIAYKLFRFEPVKAPVAVMFVVSLIAYLW